MISVAASWEDRLHKPSTICPMVSVERCNLVRSNILERQPVLALRGCVRREGAQDDDGDSNQHCREQTYGEVAMGSTDTTSTRYIRERVRCVENYLGANEAAIASKRGSPRRGSQRGCSSK